MISPVEQKPFHSIRRWSIIRVMSIDLFFNPKDFFHFVGQHADQSEESGLGWVRSTPIEHIDLSSMTARTQSGRVYALIGNAADPGDVAAMEAVRQALSNLRVDPNDVERVDSAEVALALAGQDQQRGWRM